MINHKVELHDEMHVTDFIPIIRGRTDMADIYIKEAQRYAQEARTAFKNTVATHGNVKHFEAEIKNSQKAIMFSVFAFEAHINRIGHDKLDPEIWDVLERNGTEDKWFLFPILITGKKFEIEEQLLKDFRSTIHLRNYLVHFKDYEYKELVPHPCGTNVTGIYEHVNVKNAELAYVTASRMITKIDEFLQANKKKG
jgi:hypothetical protein